MHWLVAAAIVILVLALLALKKKFIPASKIKSAVKVARRLEAEGFVPIINLLGEHCANGEKIEKTLTQYFHWIDAIRENNLKAKISVKPTQIGLAVSRNLYKYNIVRLARRARNQGVSLEIDVENLKYLDDTLSVFLEIPGEFGVRQALQAYLRRSRQNVGGLTACWRKVRLVKGAYSESNLTPGERKESLIALIEYLLLKGREPAIATVCDEELIKFVCSFSANRKIRRDAFIVQMLYGRAGKLKRRLRDEGFRVEVYTPVGPWRRGLPYLWRRMEEICDRIAG